MLAANRVLITKVLAANKIIGIDSGDELIKKSIESKTRKSSKSQNLSKVQEIFGTKTYFYLFKASFY